MNSDNAKGGHPGAAGDWYDDDTDCSVRCAGARGSAIPCLCIVSIATKAIPASGTSPMVFGLFASVNYLKTEHLLSGTPGLGGLGGWMLT